MKHFICNGGCGLQTDTEGVCEAEFCTKNGQALTECECEDGEHQAGSEKFDDEDLGE